MPEPTPQYVNSLVINKMTQAQYDGLVQKSETELYLVPDNANYVEQSSTPGLLKNDGTVDTNTYITSAGVAGKADKPTTATEGHLAKFDANKNPIDCGYAIWVGTESAYNGETKDNNTLYFIKEATT